MIYASRTYYAGEGDRKKGGGRLPWPLSEWVKGFQWYKITFTVNTGINGIRYLFGIP